jgi:ATP-dependent helicase/nuclease subunit A
MTQLPFDALPVSQAPTHDSDADALRTIREALTENLFVEAGAGTGKTSALVDRIVALVVSGVPIERIAAITFTERAAAELRERVRNGLEEKLREQGDATGALQAALASLDRAQISTIHAFCQAIVRIYAPEAGVDPAFDVQDQLMTQRRMQERWRSYLEHLGEDAVARADVDRLLSLGLRVGELEELALGLASRGELAEMLAERPLAAPEPSWPDFNRLEATLLALPIDRAPSDDGLRRRIEAVLNAVRAVAATGPEEREETLASWAGDFTTEDRYASKGRAPNWGGAPERDRVLGVLSEVAEQLDDLLAGLRAAALAAVMPRIIEFVRSDEHARGREGKLTFDDLILRTRRLLTGSPDAVRSLRERFRALLIDEFQDTDPLQVQIAAAFASDPATGAIEPGRLFLVGDPKQSIYRFRRADMATYSRTRSAMAAALFPQLTINRRSQPAILHWVNAVFGGIIGAGDRPEVQPPYNPIEPARDITPNGPGVATFGEQQQLSARETRILEAEHVAAVCRQAIGKRWQVAERTGHLRDAVFRDIAILLPTRSGLTALERALDGAGVPYRVEGGSLIYRTQEIRDLLNLLTAIDDPSDEVAVVGALRSPAFACSDVDLARHRAKGGRFGYHNIDYVTPNEHVVDSLRTLHGLHRIRHETSLAALVERVVLDRGFVETGILDQGDRNSFRRARFMIERARAFEAAGPESLRAFVSWLEQQSKAQMIDNEGSGLDDDEDAVRILTIHGAKGLEFPIVILAGMAAQPNTNQTPAYTADFGAATARIAVCVGHKTGNRRFTLGEFHALNALEADHTRAEFDRMLYVAATRARDHLLVSLHHHRRSSGSAAQRLFDAGANETPQLELPPATAGRPQSQLDSLALDLPADLTKDTFAARRQSAVAAARTVEYTSATALAPRKDEQKEEPTDETEPWARGRGGTRLGRAVHAAIQSLPLDADDAAIAAFARAQAVAEAIPHRQPAVERLVRWVVRDSEAWRRARSAQRAMREVPFALQTDGKVLEGFVDLVIQTEDGIEIVDWKTDQISPSEVPGRLKQYELQAGLYVHGLQSATGIRVRRITYVFAGARIETSPGEPGALANAARQRLSEPGAL